MKFFIPNEKVEEHLTIHRWEYFEMLTHLGIEYTVTRTPDSDAILFVMPLAEVQVHGNDNWIEAIKSYVYNHSWVGPVLIWYPEEQFNWVQGHRVLKTFKKDLAYPMDKVFYVSGDMTPVNDPILDSNNVLFFPYFAYRVSRLQLPTTYEQVTTSKHYICPVFHARPARQYLLHYLFKHNMLSKGYVSFKRTKYKNLSQLLEISKGILPDDELEIVTNDMVNFLPLEENNFQPKYNLFIDNKELAQGWAWRHQKLIESLYPYMQTAKVYLSPESGFNWLGDVENPTGFITEKTFFPVIGKMPFVIHGEKHLLKTMQDMGYETFHSYVDESYDNYNTLRERTLKIINTINQFCELADVSMFSEIVEHNHNVLLTTDYKQMVLNILEKVFLTK